MESRRKTSLYFNNKNLIQGRISYSYANFGKPEDLLRYMQEENIETVTVESEYWGAKLAPMKMTQKDVEDWVKMKEE